MIVVNMLEAPAGAILAAVGEQLTNGRLGRIATARMDRGYIG
jgi:hypothetical protein